MRIDARPLAAARRLANGALDLLLPPRSLDEGREAAGPVQWRGITAHAWSRIAFIEAPVCDGCGAPFDFEVGPRARCEDCARHPLAFDRARAACLYDEHSRDLILKLKHGDRTDLCGLFARWVARAAADLRPGLDAVAPVPLYRWRLLGRRFNQAAEIARPFARQWGVRYYPDALVRRRSTGSQAGKTGDARRVNVEGAFRVPRGWRSRVAGRRLLLVDDVLTTGATVDACARALKAAGATSVDVAVIARVRPLTRPTA